MCAMTPRPGHRRERAPAPAHGPGVTSTLTCGAQVSLSFGGNLVKSGVISGVSALATCVRVCARGIILLLREQ